MIYEVILYKSTATSSKYCGEHFVAQRWSARYEQSVLLVAT